ncbi:hypothetical protein C8R46DRAFT_1048148 [Mycena filopes]|nr:hypothetical protein C8R46DRAFT_1048148 [Mycena filopes]
MSVGTALQICFLPRFRATIRPDWRHLRPQLVPTGSCADCVPAHRQVLNHSAAIATYAPQPHAPGLANARESLGVPVSAVQQPKNETSHLPNAPNPTRTGSPCLFNLRYSIMGGRGTPRATRCDVHLVSSISNSKLGPWLNLRLPWFISTRQLVLSILKEHADFSERATKHARNLAIQKKKRKKKRHSSTKRMHPARSRTVHLASRTACK